MKKILIYWEKYFRRIWFYFFKERPLKIFGKYVIKISPKFVVDKALKVAFNDRNLFVELILAGYSQNYTKLDEKSINKINKEFIWGQAGTQWHKNKLIEYEKEFDTSFFKKKIDLIKKLESMDLKEFNIVEIGCGNGFLLNYLYQNTNAKSYTGIDLSLEIIEFNKNYYPENLKFIHIDILDYIKNNDINNTIFVTSGVLLYFPIETIMQLLIESNKSNKNILFAINEIVNDKQIDLVDIAHNTRFAFSYDYVKLFDENNWNIDFFNHDKETKRITLVANNRQ